MDEVQSERLVEIEREKDIDLKFRLYKKLKGETIDLARVDPKVFIDFVFNYVSTPMHNEWQDFMTNMNHGQILAPRDHGKSEQLTVGRVCWEIGKNPNMRIKICTESDDLAGKFIPRIAATLTKNERYKEVFPDIRPSDIGGWTKFQLTVNRQEHHKDPSIEGAGIMTSSTGGRADLIIFDDIAGLRNTLHFPRMREQVKEAFYSNWLNFLHGPEAKWFLIGTPWHVLDIIWEIKNNDAIPKAPIRAVDNDFNSPWPEHCPRDYLKDRLKILRRRHYNRAYRLIPISDEEAWINPGAVDSCIDRNLKVFDVIKNTEIVKFTGIDCGHREGPNASPSVIYTIGRTPDGKRIPCDIRISTESSILELGRVIIDVYNTLKPAKIFCENNGAQKYLVDLITSIGPTGLPIEGYFTGSQKINIETGVPSLLAEIESGAWVIPLGSGGGHDETCKCAYCIWMMQVKDFPLGPQDALMASWLALEALRKVMERASKQGGFSIWKW